MITLKKPIKPGFRRAFTIVPDEAVDQAPDGTLFRSAAVAGDSTVTYNPDSNPTSLKGWINGDGSTGDKSVSITADGHLGEGDVPVSLTVNFTVANPDATSLEAFTEDSGPDTQIPIP